MAILAILGFIAWAFVSSVLNGWAFSILWGWFIVPTFAIPALSVPLAIGISMCVSYVTYVPKFVKGEDEDTTGLIIFSLLKPFIVLLFAYIVKQFI